MIDYYKNCRTMNWLPLSACKKVYSLHFDGDPHGDGLHMQSQMKDAHLSQDMSAALGKNDDEEASRFGQRISGKDLRDFQSALIDEAETLDTDQKKLQKDLGKFQDNLKAAEIRESFFGGNSL